MNKIPGFCFSAPASEIYSIQDVLSESFSASIKRKSPVLGFKIIYLVWKRIIKRKKEKRKKEKRKP